MKSTERTTDAIVEHREELETLAESDLPVSWVAATLLKAAEEADE